MSKEVGLDHSVGSALEEDLVDVEGERDAPVAMTVMITDAVDKRDYLVVMSYAVVDFVE